MLGVFVLVLLVFGLSGFRIVVGHAAARCGVERWRVKTLTDPEAASVNFIPKDTTVDALRALPASGVGMRTPRLRGAEMRVYRVRATLVGAKLEADGDIHLAIADTRSRSHTIIVELPDPGCTSGAPSRRRGQMTKARISATSARALALEPAAGGAGSGCNPNYSPCLPVVSDLNCSDIPDSLKPIRVIGSDPYRLDADGDGLACE